MITRRQIALAQVAVALLLLLGTGRLAAGARAQPGAPEPVYLPLVISPGRATAPAPPEAPAPPAGGLPAELVGTWYSGRLLNLQFYNRETGVWSDPGGLGHMYVFGADGAYTLVSYLKLGEGTTCVSSVSKYQAGVARVSGGALLLTPAVARTRTQICASAPSELEGPHETYSLPWRVGEDAGGRTRLWLSEAQGETEYYKDGLAPQVVGDWASGDGGAIWLYDPASGQWAEPTGARSEWYALYADGTFRHGAVDAGFGDDPCRTVTMLYEEGALSGRGGDIILQATASLRRTASLCDPGDAVVEARGGGYERWSWSMPEGSGGATLDLLRIEGGFRSITLGRVE